MDNVQGQTSSSVSAKSPTLVSQAGGLSNSASDAAVKLLQSSVEAIEDAGEASQFLDYQLAAFANSEDPGAQDLPTLTASITAEADKISALVRGNTRVSTTLTKALTVLGGLDAKTKMRCSGAALALTYGNRELEACLDG